MIRIRATAFLMLVVLSTRVWAQTLPSSYAIPYFSNANVPVYNQGSYGTCWAFATMESIESNIVQQGGSPAYNANDGQLWLSEADLAWNSGFLPQVAQLTGGSLSGAIGDGGNFLMAAAYLARGGGPLLDSQAPYSSMGSGPLAYPTGQAPSYYVRDINWMSGNVNAIKNAVMNSGSVAAVWQSTSPYTYNSAVNANVYYQAAPTNTSTPGYNNQPDHAIDIIGWNDAAQAWVCRNSWGSGNLSTFYVSYNDFYTGNDTPDKGACNGGAVSFQNVVANNYQKIYSHNPLGWTAQQPHAYAFNAFQASQTGDLQSVSFYTTAAQVGYTVNIYEKFSNGALSQLVSSTSGTESFEGFHTVDLANLVPLSAGQNFYIELWTSNGQQANDGDIPLQDLLDFDSSAAASTDATTSALPGQSFFSDDGASWTDLQTVDTSANFAIDGLTIAVPEPSLAALPACLLAVGMRRRKRLQ